MGLRDSNSYNLFKNEDRQLSPDQKAFLFGPECTITYMNPVSHRQKKLWLKMMIF